MTAKDRGSKFFKCFFGMQSQSVEMPPSKEKLIALFVFLSALELALSLDGSGLRSLLSDEDDEDISDEEGRHAVVFGTHTRVPNDYESEVIEEGSVDVSVQVSVSWSQRSLLLIVIGVVVASAIGVTSAVISAYRKWTEMRNQPAVEYRTPLGHSLPTRAY